MAKNKDQGKPEKAPRPGSAEWKKAVEEELEDFDEANPNWKQEHGGQK